LNSEPAALVFCDPAVSTSVKELARQVEAKVADLSLLIEKYTSVACPSCLSVCCINRHSHHDSSDLALLHALGYAAPALGPGLDDAAPCGFLGARGCMLPRIMRPYRCTWYFCDALLNLLRDAPVREYRVFMNVLSGLTDKRLEMLREFEAEAAAIQPHKEIGNREI